MNRLEYYMYNFNVVELKKFLGESLAELFLKFSKMIYEYLRRKLDKYDFVCVWQ